MRSIPSLESRIARIAEQYGDGLLRRYATEAGEAERDRDEFRFGCHAMYFLSVAPLVLGFLLGYAGSLVHIVAQVRGWL